MSLHCNDVRDWLKRDFDGNAEPSGEVMEHLESCDDCRALAQRNKELARASRDALPSARVPFDFEDRVMEALVEPADESALDDAVRPHRRSPLFAAAALAAIALLLLWSRPDSEDEADGTLAEGGEQKAAAHFVVRLSDSGKLSYDGDAVSLDGLAMLFKRHKPNSVLVRGDAGAAWQHVQWILVVCAQEGIADTHFAVGNGAPRDARLPRDLGLGKNRDRIRIRVGIKTSNQHFFGDPVVYRVADRDVTDADQVAEWIRAAKAAAREVNEPVYGEIQGGHGVPFQRIVETMDRFRAAGVKDVQFFGTQLPSEKIRRRATLPLPGRAGQQKVVPGQVADVVADRAAAQRVRMAQLAQRAELQAEFANLNKQVGMLAEVLRQRPADADLSRSYNKLRAELTAVQAQLKKLGGAPGLPGRPGGQGGRGGVVAAPMVQVVDAAVAKWQAEVERLQVKVAREPNIAKWNVELDRAKLELQKAKDLEDAIATYKQRRQQMHAVKALRKRVIKAEALLARNPGNAAIEQQLADAKAQLAAAETERANAARAIARLEAQLKQQQAALDRVKGPIVSDEPFAGPAAPAMPLRITTPKDGAGWTELLRKRAETAHSLFQGARARDDKAALETAKNMLDETRDLLDVAADLKGLEAKRAQVLKEGDPKAKDALEKEITRLHAKLKAALPAAPRGKGGGRRGVGTVLKVTADTAIISVGSDDGVKVGDRFSVRRGAQFVGRITIERIGDEVAIGKIDTQLKGPAAPMQAGDVAQHERAGFPRRAR
ncbi:MAG: hypothetical protein ACYTGN_17945 [Planctomycetota bacterium]|jgi:biopolymer transport protein ExbD/tetratricopeptide (TPR) repeat protein